ncbi:MAG: acyl-CoA thioesterase II [Polyangiales bacterium]
MALPIDSLQARLDLERLDDDLYRGTSPIDGRPRIFGGLVAAQSHIAACRTVEGRTAHSLHGYFLREGDTKVPVIYHVDRIRDGRSFATRRVVAKQHGKAIFNMSVSFQSSEDGLEHQEPMPEAPPPLTVPTHKTRLEAYQERSSHPAIGFLLSLDRPIERREVDHIDLLEPKPHQGTKRTWFRAAGTLDADPAMHQAMLAYASDYGLLGTSFNRHGHSFLTDKLILASLDHAIWFHAPFRADAWMLYTTESPRASGGRGLNFGTIHAEDGTLVASVAQEGLIRVRRPRTP